MNCWRWRRGNQSAKVKGKKHFYKWSLLFEIKGLHKPLVGGTPLNVEYKNNALRQGLVVFCVDLSMHPSVNGHHIDVIRIGESH